MIRRLAACTMALVLALLTVWPPAAALAQANPKDTSFVVGEGAGSYVQAAVPALTGAVDRLASELDAFPGDATPKQAKDASWRRRILELRLLMDLNAFAYDKDKMKSYRDIVDHAYEVSGSYQDLDVFEKEIGQPINPDIVAARKVEADDGVGPLRDPGFRNELKGFFSSPLKGARKNGGPGIWDLTETKASDGFDAIGNAALLQTGVIRHLQGSDLGVNDINDPNQALYFHVIRKQVRDVIIMSAMYPEIKNGVGDTIKPLTDLVNDYGDVMDAYFSLQFAQQNGMDTGKVAPELAREFGVAQGTKDQIVNSHALDAVAIQLNAVRDAHGH
jgi:hypothetical protein